MRASTSGPNTDPNIAAWSKQWEKELQREEEKNQRSATSLEVATTTLSVLGEAVSESPPFPLPPENSLLDVIGGLLMILVPLETYITVEVATLTPSVLLSEVPVMVEMRVLLGALSPRAALGASRATTLGAVLGAGIFGWGIGSVIDWGITRTLHKPLSARIYEALHPEEKLPPSDRTRDGKTK